MTLHADADHRLQALVEAKAATTISVCLPARDEAATVGAVVARIVADLVERRPLVDEVLVVDDRSTDATAACGPATCKREAMWKSLAASSGELVVCATPTLATSIPPSSPGWSVLCCSIPGSPSSRARTGAIPTAGPEKAAG